MKFDCDKTVSSGQYCMIKIEHAVMAQLLQSCHHYLNHLNRNFSGILNFDFVVEYFAETFWLITDAYHDYIQSDVGKWWFRHKINPRIGKFWSPRVA